jgi:hypothetical protein
MMIRRKVPIAEVAAFLGHSSTDVTYQVYVHLYAPDLKGAAKAIAETIVGSGSPVVSRTSVDELIDDILG